jgi:hypothetical protein
VRRGEERDEGGEGERGEEEAVDGARDRGVGRMKKVGSAGSWEYFLK